MYICDVVVLSDLPPQKKSLNQINQRFTQSKLDDGVPEKESNVVTDDEGAFYHVFFLRRVLQTSSVRATVSEEIESFRVHVILNRVFSNAKMRKSPLFFVASDDSKDHERPNKDSKR